VAYQPISADSPGVKRLGSTYMLLTSRLPLIRAGLKTIAALSKDPNYQAGADMVSAKDFMMANVVGIQCSNSIVQH
jgi:hypothetical protein